MCNFHKICPKSLAMIFNEFYFHVNLMSLNINYKSLSAGAIKGRRNRKSLRNRLLYVFFYSIFVASPTLCALRECLVNILGKWERAIIIWRQRLSLTLTLSHLPRPLKYVHPYSLSLSPHHHRR